MEVNRAQISYSALNFFYWATNATICSFSSAFLLPQGFSSFEIGLIMSFGNAGAVLLQPLLAEYADRTEKHTVSQILTGICGIFLILTGFLFLMKGHSVFLAVFYTSAYIVHLCMVPLLNELNYRLEKAGYAMSFGAARAMGSLGYSIMSAFAGFAAEIFGIRMYPVLTAAVILLILLILMGLGKLLKPGGKKMEGKKKAENIMAFVNTHRRLFMVSLGGLCFMFCSTITGSYLLQVMIEVGGSAKEMGIGLSLAAVSEIPVMFFYHRMREKWPVRTLLKASGIGYVLKQVTLLFAGSYVLVLISQLLQFMSFALYLPSSVAYAHENTEEEDSIKGQALMTTAGTAAGLLASLIGGFVIDRYGVRNLLMICVVMSVLGMGLIFVFTEQKRV